MSARTDKNDPLGARRLTAANCAVALRDNGDQTISELAQLTGLSRPTVETSLRSLITSDIVQEVSVPNADARGAGRPARSFRFNAAVGYCAGVDVGIHNIRVALSDGVGRIVGWSSEPVSLPMTGAERLAAVKRAVNDCLKASGTPRSRLLALGVAVTGLVGQDGRIVLSRNFPDWEGVDLAGHLNAEFDCAVTVDNDIRLAALAEHRIGIARLSKDVVYISAGHRLSMGLIIDGHLRRGHHSAAGEIGETVMYGNLRDGGELIWTSAPSGEQVFWLARNGNSDAQAEVARFIEQISFGIATIAMAIDPDLVVIGGGLSQAGDALLEPFRLAVDAAIPLPVTPTIVASALGAESVVLGAMVNALESATRSLFGVSGVPDPVIDYTSTPRDDLAPAV